MPRSLLALFAVALAPLLVAAVVAGEGLVRSTLLVELGVAIVLLIVLGVALGRGARHNASDDDLGSRPFGKAAAP